MKIPLFISQLIVLFLLRLKMSKLVFLFLTLTLWLILVFPFNYLLLVSKDSIQFNVIYTVQIQGFEVMKYKYFINIL